MKIKRIPKIQKQHAVIAGCLAACALLLGLSCLFMRGRAISRIEQPHAMVNHIVYYYDASSAPLSKLPEGYAVCGRTVGVGNVGDGNMENFYTSFGYIGEEVFVNARDADHIYIYTHLFGGGAPHYLRFIVQ